MKSRIWNHNPLHYRNNDTPVSPDTWVEVAGADKQFTGPFRAKDRYWGIGMDTDNPIYYYKIWDGPVPSPDPVLIPSLVDQLTTKFRSRLRGAADSATVNAMAEDAIEIVRDYLAS